MSSEKDNKVDAEVRAELAEFKAEINKTIVSSISEGFKEVEKHLSELFNKDIDHIKDTQNRHGKHHQEHFENDKEVRKQITDIKEYIHEEFKKHEETKDRKKNLGTGYVILLCSIVATITAVITLLIK